MDPEISVDSEVLVVGLDVRAEGLVGELRAAGYRVTIVDTVMSTVDVEDMDLTRFDIAVHVTPDHPDRKHAELTRLAGLVADGTIIACVSDGMSACDLATAVTNPSRFAVLVVQYGIDGAATIEIVPADATDPVTTRTLVDLVNTLPGRSPIVVGDRPGHLLNGLLFPYLNDVINELDDGLAGVEDIDVALRLGLGYRVGPLSLLDRLGLPTYLRATEAIYAQTRDERYAAPSLLQRMVASGRRGETTGDGFHTQERGEA